jgi:WD40 repeat protein
MVLEGHTEEVIAVALSAEGQRAVSGSFDDTVRFWDLGNNAPAHLLGGHTKKVYIRGNIR